MDTRNWSHAKMLGISMRRLRVESFGHPWTIEQNRKIEAMGEAYWAKRHAEQEWDQRIKTDWNMISTNANEQE